MEQVPLKKTHFIYYFIVALDSISFGLITPILAPLLVKKSVFFAAFSPFTQYFLYGLIISLFHIGFAIGAPLLGTLSDQLGRKRVLLWSLLITLFACIAYMLAFYFSNIWIFMVARMLAGVGASSQGVAQAAVANLSRQLFKPIAISSVGIGMTVGLVIGPLIGSLWSHTASWLPFSVVIGICLLNIFLLMRYVKEQTSNIKIIKNPLFFNEKIKKLLTTFLLFEIGWSLYFQSLSIWFGLNWHLDHKTIAYLISLISTMLMINLFFGFRIGLKFVPQQKLTQIGLFIGTFSLVCTLASLCISSFLVCSFFTVFAVALIYPGLISDLSELFPKYKQGLLMGVTDGLLAFAFILSGILSGLLSYVHIKLAFFIACVSWGIATIYYFKLNRVPICNFAST